MAKVYDEEFYDYVERTARGSALLVVPVLRDLLAPASVLDVGCGRGLWLDAWRRSGVGELVGVDGSYVDPTTLVIGRDHFVCHDLSLPFDLGRRFDLVQSLEVAEHLPLAAAAGFIASVARHGDAVVFSAAVPGQGGSGHINEQPLEYWRRLFEQLGFDAYDAVRPRIVHTEGVAPWYRFNSIVYARQGSAAARRLQHYRVPTETRLQDLSDLPWRARRLLLRGIPEPLVSRLAAWRHRLLPF